MRVFSFAPGYELWLASGSPRRKALIDQLGLPYQIIVPVNAEPEQLAGESPDKYVLRAAAAKAAWAQAQIAAGQAVIIAADTVVAANGCILGKPRTPAMASQMLMTLNASWHNVYTGIAIARAGLAPVLLCEKTAVHFANWPPAVLDAYLQTGDSLDKAGAYGIQGDGAFLADELRGSWSNVVGLPLCPLIQSLLALGLIFPSSSLA